MRPQPHSIDVLNVVIGGDNIKNKPHIKYYVEYKRRVAVEKRICDLTPEDSRVAVIGTVVSIDEESLLFDMEDSTGMLTVILPSNELMKHIKIGSLVRVIGLILPFEEGVELRAEIIQDFSELSPELFSIFQNLLGNPQKL